MRFRPQRPANGRGMRSKQIPNPGAAAKSIGTPPARAARGVSFGPISAINTSFCGLTSICPTMDLTHMCNLHALTGFRSLKKTKASVVWPAAGRRSRTRYFAVRLPSFSCVAEEDEIRVM